AEGAAQGTGGRARRGQSVSRRHGLGGAVPGGVLRDGTGLSGGAGRPDAGVPAVGGEERRAAVLLNRIREHGAGARAGRADRQGEGAEVLGGNRAPREQGALRWPRG